MNGLLEHYIKKSEQKVKLEAKLKEENKTFEDAITNKYIAPLSTQKPSESNEKTK